MQPKKIQRAEPAWAQLVKHYRDTITSGALADGDRLPASRTLAEDWGVAYTTVAKALRQLQAEGLVKSSNQGTHVTWHKTSTFSPHQRLRAQQDTSRAHPASDEARITAAGLATPPKDVAEAMSLDDPPPQLIRRARVHLFLNVAVEYSISWLPADLLEAVPELAEPHRIPHGTAGRIAEVTGRTVRRVCYRQCGRTATDEEAHHLGITPGSPILAGENWWYGDTDANDIIEFGQYVIPPNRWVGACDDV
jgi:DNA-binding GntR family transcriptional regulator